MSDRHWPHGVTPDDGWPNPPYTVCGLPSTAAPTTALAGTREHVTCTRCAELLATGRPWAGVYVYVHGQDGRLCWYDGNRLDLADRWRIDNHDRACPRHHPLPGRRDAIRPEDEILLDLIPALAKPVADRLRTLMVDAALGRDGTATYPSARR